MHLKSDTITYLFGFNGQEKDNEIGGTGNYYSFEYRVHDTRLGRFLSVDPISAEFPWNSTYAFAENRVIDGIELEGLEYVGSNGQPAGPLNAEYAKSVGAELEPQFQNNPEGPDGQKNINLPEFVVNAQHPDKARAERDAEQNKQNQIVSTFGYRGGTLNNATLRPYNLLEHRPDIAMSCQIMNGVKIGLEGEFLGLGLNYGLSQIGKIEVPLYRVFGGESRVLGSYYTPINPSLFGNNYPRFAGLPSENSAAFSVKVNTPINNLNFGSIGLAKPIGINGGRVVPEIKVINIEGVRVTGFKVNSFTNPAFKPLLPIKF